MHMGSVDMGDFRRRSRPRDDHPRFGFNGSSPQIGPKICLTD
jgi:hypothetical protein